jgi:glycosyltransferase involved in cell wall biosynthesis
MTGIEQARFICEGGLDILTGRYTIGLWPWELPDWPASGRYVFSVVDEIWGISSYTANAYRTAPCPVYAMSLPVIADPIGSETRADFGLPKDDYLFIYSFDFNSTLARKNPEAAIRAFRQAFPAGRKEKVGLVLKASHSGNAKDDAWDRIKSMVSADPRMHLIDETLRKATVLALYRCCDSFVSLHRAEGFGRGIAESLLLDMPVIVTGFSGNMDYCDDPSIGLVRYHLRELAKNEYFWGQGQHWAEPDIHHAAQLMREAAASGRKSLGRKFDFSPATVGEHYARRLRELFHQLNPSGSLTC